MLMLVLFLFGYSPETGPINEYFYQPGQQARFAACCDTCILLLIRQTSLIFFAYNFWPQTAVVEESAWSSTVVDLMIWPRKYHSCLQRWKHNRMIISGQLNIVYFIHLVKELLSIKARLAPKLPARIYR